MEVIKMWCEWDIGINDCLWLNLEKAKADATQALEDSGLEETLDECLADGLIGFEAVEVIS